MSNTTAPLLQKSKGLSLIELLMVVAIIGVTVVPLLLTYRSYRTSQALSSSVEQVANHTRSVHIFSREAREQREWGIRNSSNTSYILYSTGSTGEVIEQQYSLDSGTQFATSFDILFGIGTGNTDQNYKVEIVNDNGKRGHVNTSSTGIVEVRFE